jgi:hypothetical protein
VESEQLIGIIDALSAHPQLEKLEMARMNVGTSVCGALATLIHATTDIRTLNLTGSNIDDEGVKALVGALADSRLSVLSLSDTPNISTRGWRSLTALLENPASNLERLELRGNNIGDEGALIFANALTRNRKLKTLNLHSNEITSEGWSAFSRVLCNTSSINNTFLSNHTLENLSYEFDTMPADVRSLLALNRSNQSKKQVAIKKILKHHRHFDMQPFFEWDLKVLPIAVDWFDRARFVYDNNEAGIGNHKLGAIYQFIRAMPEVFE